MKMTLLTSAMAILLCSFAAAQQYKVIYSFNGPPTDGSSAVGNLISDAAGNLYGVTSFGGTSSVECGFSGINGCGVAFELSPGSGGIWAEDILYNFCSSANCADGAIPEGGLAADSMGNLYGLAASGGIPCATNSEGCGVVYELSPPSTSGASWTYSVIYSFCSVLSGSICTDGDEPRGPLAVDSSGNLYGATGLGGVNDDGVVFQLRKGTGTWTESVLHSFCSEPGCSDGGFPEGGVVLGKSATLYGTTTYGGSSRDSGVLFKLTLGSGGPTETILYTFGTNAARTPAAPVSLDAAGNLYTTYSRGGTDDDGGLLALVSGAVHLLPFGSAVNGAWPTTGLIIDSLHKLAYGVTQLGGSGGVGSGRDGTIYEVNQSGKETVLYNFCEQSGCPDGYYPVGLMSARPGAFFGTTAYGGPGGNGVVFQFTP